MAKKRDDSAKVKPEGRKASKPKTQDKPALKVEKSATKEKKPAPVRKPRSVKPARLETNEHPLVGAVFAEEEINADTEAIEELAVEAIPGERIAENGAEIGGLEQKIVKTQKGTEAVQFSSMYQPSNLTAEEVVSNDAIANRAWQIWLKEGCPEGRALEHWLQAESELRRIQ